MATTITAFEVTCFAGASFLDGSMLNMDVGTLPVVAIRWRVPPGPNGLLEWWLGQDGVPIFPNGNARGVIANDEWDTWQLDSPPQNTVWGLFCINAGTLDHVVELQFYQDSLSGQTTGTGGGSIADGFPVVESDFATMWGPGSGGGILV